MRDRCGGVVRNSAVHNCQVVPLSGVGNNKYILDFKVVVVGIKAQCGAHYVGLICEMVKSLTGA